MSAIGKMKFNESGKSRSAWCLRLNLLCGGFAFTFEKQNGNMKEEFQYANDDEMNITAQRDFTFFNLFLRLRFSVYVHLKVYIYKY